MPASPAPEKARTLPLQPLDETAGRFARVAAAVALAIVAGHVVQRIAQPQIAPVLDDPVIRLVALAAVLMGAGLYALHRYKAVTSRTLLALGIAFEVVVGLSIAMVETSQPFEATVPLLGVSAVGLWIVIAGAVIPRQPHERLYVALATASTWPLAYAINSARVGFVTASWWQTLVWPSINYVLALCAYVLGRWSRTAASPAAEPARNLGSYQLMWPIGEGSMGEVWRASHNMLARPAAVKLVKSDAGRQELLFYRFHREANAIAGLQSPHTVYLYDFGTTPDGRLYYVMELLDGISLQTLVTTFGPQPASRVIAILTQICRSLEEAHEKQIVHRDLKPSNVMLCQVAQIHDFVKVLDFGLAKPLGDHASQLTVQGVTLGTPEYMAPEVARASPGVDGRADLYALGCIGYILLTGTLVFTDTNPVSVALKHMKTAPDPPSRRTDRIVPVDLERVILKCLEKEPGARPAGARELARMLESCEVPAWTEEDAAAWWRQHLPPASAFRSASHAPSEAAGAMEHTR